MRGLSIATAYPHISRSRGYTKRGMGIIHSKVSYEQVLAKCDLCPLQIRRQEITDRLFHSVIKDNDHKLKKLLPDICKYSYFVVFA